MLSQEDTVSIENRAIIKDIETSSITELSVWAKSLGLKDSTNIESLKKSIAKYYKLKLTPKIEQTNTKIIKINRAELSKYYTLEEVDESIAEFEGRVDIIIDDLEQEIQHAIVADKVNFNRTLNSVTAFGNVEYIKTEKGKPELITADSLTFNLSNWKGSLLKCISKQNKVIDEEEMVFYYVTGEIKKSDTQVMGMSDVTIQTVIGSPYFNISALDLWMLDSSDFVIVLPSVKVGHVPVFIAPFYYHSDTSLYFNPVFGERTREGTIFQNTIYLMGAKEIDDKESNFSFLSFDDDEALGNLELNGLTLVASGDKTKYSPDYSKIMLDYYSKLGIFVGNETSLTLKPYINNFELQTGLGFSRNIDSSDGSIYTSEESEWNNSYFLDEELPFRYLLYMSLTSPIVELDFKILSDSYFRSDFLNRAENFMWINYATSLMDDGLESLGDDSTEYDRNTVVTETIDGKSVDKDYVVNDYSWGIDFTKFAPSTTKLNPFLSSFELDLEKIEIEYKSKVSLDDEVDLYSEFDPAYKFFYPDNILLPLKLTIKGSFFDTDYQKSRELKKDVIKIDDAVKDEDSELDGKDNKLLKIENPVSIEPKKKEIKATENDFLTLEKDDTFKDVKIKSNTSSALFNADMTYVIKMPSKIDGYWDNTDWENRSDIDYDLDDSGIKYKFDPSATINNSINILDSFLVFNNNLNGYIFKSAYLDIDDQIDLLEIYKNNRTVLINDFKTTISLLKLNPEIERHTLSTSYNLKSTLYQNLFDQDEYELNGEVDAYYLEESFEWTDDFIDKHELDVKYIYKLDFSETNIGYKKILPPIDQVDDYSVKQVFDFKVFNLLENKSETNFLYSIVAETDDEDEVEIISADQKYSMGIYGAKISAVSGFDYSESYIDEDSDTDEWDFSPLDLSLEYKLLDFLSFNTGFNYSFEDEKWNQYDLSLKLWDFNISLKSIYEAPKSWDSDDLNWTQDDSEIDELLLDSISITHNLDIKKFKFWRNRITLDVKSDLTIEKKLIEVDKSSFRYNLKFNLEVFEFLNLSFKSTSVNKAMFYYWEDDATTLGINTDKNILTDFVKSFNFFSDSDREESSFNLETITIAATYIMPDWNLIFSYSGSPEVNDSEYEWNQEFSFFIQWKPLGLVRSKVVNEDDNWTVSTSKTD
ncbi:MAG: hypothetical protein OCD02_21525 [Spirochaetaceae bacterium]